MEGVAITGKEFDRICRIPVFGVVVGMVQPSESPSPEKVGDGLWPWMSGIFGLASGVASAWQFFSLHWWRAVLALVFLVVATIVFFARKRKRPLVRAWLVRLLQTPEMVSAYDEMVTARSAYNEMVPAYEKAVDALALRGNVLGAATDFSTWVGDFIAIPHAQDRDRAFASLNNAFIDTLRDIFTQAERIAIFAPSTDKQNLEIRFSARFDPERPKLVKLPINKSAAGQAYLTGTNYFQGDLLHEPNKIYHALPGSRRIQTLLCVPVTAHGRTYAVLSMDNVSSHAINSDIVELVATLCRTMALAWAVSSIVPLEGGNPQ